MSPSQKRILICPTVCICSLEISCLSRKKDKRRRGGHLVGRQQREESAWIHTCTLGFSKGMSPRSGPLGVLLLEPAVRRVLLLGWGQKNLQMHTCHPSYPWTDYWLAFPSRRLRLRTMADTWLLLVLEGTFLMWLAFFLWLHFLLGSLFSRLRIWDMV